MRSCGKSASCGPATRCASGASRQRRRAAPINPVGTRSRRCPPSGDARRAICVRRAGESNLLVEFGAPVLDLVLRFQVQALLDELQRARTRRHRRSDAGHPLAADPLRPGAHHAARRSRLAAGRARALPSVDRMRLPSRIVHLPLSWDDPATQLATAALQQSVRADAPWCPDNIEFIRRINGLDIARRGARHRVRRQLPGAWAWAMSTSARRWRRRSIRGIAWSPPSTTRRAPGRRRMRWASAAPTCACTAWKVPAATSSSAARCRCGIVIARRADFRDGKQWLLRFFDQIRFYPVSAEELLRMRAGFPYGRYPLRIEETHLDLGEYLGFLDAERDSIDAFRRRQRAAFDAERERWRAAGLSETPVVETAAKPAPPALARGLHCRHVARSPAASGRSRSRPARSVEKGETLVIMESMKMEIAVVAETAGDRWCRFTSRPESAPVPATRCWSLRPVTIMSLDLTIASLTRAYRSGALHTHGAGRVADRRNAAGSAVAQHLDQRSRRR